MQTNSAKILIDGKSSLKFVTSPHCTARALVFLDSHDRCIKAVNAKGMVEKIKVLPYLPGGFDIRPDGGWLISDAVRRKIFLWGSAGPRQIADLRNLAGHFLGDIVTDRQGGMYVVNSGYDFLDPLVDPVPNGVIIYVDKKGNSSVVARKLFLPGGMYITPDNGTLIVAEALAHRLTAFLIRHDGSLQCRRVWTQFHNRISPHGICPDQQGGIWVSTKKPLALRVKDGGEIIQAVKTKYSVYAVAMGPDKNRSLYLCTSVSNDPVITRQKPGAVIEVAEF